MLTSEKARFWSGGISRSMSEGNLFDMEARKSSRNCDITDPGLPLDWPEDFTLHGNNASSATNPFWNELSASNPFLDDITQLRNNQKRDNISILKEDPLLFFREIETGNSFDSSGDELDVHRLLRQSSSRKSGRSKSVSELLDILDDTAHAHQNIHNFDQILEQDLEWLRNDREAYKMAWLSHRHLARSCLDLSTINQSPGWAQTQVAETTVVCKLNHQGGSVQLPESDITVHVPQGHVAVGEFQEVSLRAFLDPPQKLNHDLSCTISPLLEIMLGNLNTMEAILLEMKIGAEVKRDPFSQVMAEIVCLHSLDKEGPFKALNNCYIYKDTIQVKLVDLSQVMYLVVAAQTKGTQSPVATIWDYIHRTISVGIYGPKYIHPSFTAVFTVCGHSYMPGKLTISDIKKGGKPNTSPVVFQLWGKHSFLLEKPQDLNISVLSCDPDFEVKAERKRKEVKQKHLQSGQAVHQQFFFSLVDSREMHLFVFCVDVHRLLRQSSSRKSGRSKSVSELLDILDDTAHAHQNIHNFDQILEQDLEWLRNDREAYKMAWLSHRHLARSCLDLSTINQSPGWAQTQVAETTVVCKLNHQGGSVQLPESDITVHVPQGHVAVGEFQEVSLRAFLDPPQKLNHDLSCTISPLLEIMLGNLNTMEAILLEMKIGAEVKRDPFSQVMAEIVCLHSLDKEGPFKALNNCYIYKDTIQVKLVDLSQVMYLVVAAQTKGTQSPVATIWDYIHRTISVGIYGPKYIHPSFTAVFTVCGHSYMPGKLTISDIKKGGKPNTSPVVFQLWGKHSFLLEKPQDLNISVLSCDPDFEVKAERKRKEVKQKHLQSGQAVHQQFFFSLVDSREMHLFVFCVQVEPRSGRPVTQFFITSPDPAPNLKSLSNLPSDLQKKKEINSSPLLPTVHVKYPTFQDKKLNFTSYGITQKTVIRQNKIEYLLEYFKGDTVALLGEGKVKAIGQSKVKEWYVGVLRGKIGLLHCKNIRVIAKEQVMSMSDNVFTTRNLLEQITLPLKKLTYIYSVVLTLVSEKVYDWKVLAYVLGYSHLALEDFDQLQADKESEKVAYVVKKLKEDCHADRNARKFLYELTVALLKIDCQGLVVHLVQEAAILTSAVKLGKGWRELAEKLVRLTKRQMEAYEIPHQGKSGDLAVELCFGNQ
uniref:Metastasis-associated in colon cancer protein 1 n=1 Tax=Bos mutus grunniens TaxID=30521 RepID=A0A8B9W9E9_BOSMU